MLVFLIYFIFSSQQIQRTFRWTYCEQQVDWMNICCDCCLKGIKQDKIKSRLKPSRISHTIRRNRTTSAPPLEGSVKARSILHHSTSKQRHDNKVTMQNWWRQLHKQQIHDINIRGLMSCCCFFWSCLSVIISPVLLILIYCGFFALIADVYLCFCKSTLGFLKSVI